MTGYDHGLATHAKCNVCGTEIEAYGTSIGDVLNGFGRHLEMLDVETVDTAKLEPVLKFIEVSSGSARYSTTRNLTPIELMDYYKGLERIAITPPTPEDVAAMVKASAGVMAYAKTP